MSRRLIVSGGSRPRELVLVGTLIVGRDPACDISETNDPLMSRRHAAFNAGPREVMVRDLGSRNGILVNGVKTPEVDADQRRRGADRPSAGAFVDEVGPFKDVPLADGASPRRLTRRRRDPRRSDAAAAIDQAVGRLDQEDSRMSSAATPDKIGRYQILERVGRGGMGVLYRGFDPVLDREVAIKVMLADFSEDTEQMRPRFYREAKAAAKLQHRNIVTMFEFAEENNQPHIVMEFLRGAAAQRADGAERRR